jgi:hypothetical protein
VEGGRKRADNKAGDIVSSGCGRGTIEVVVELGSEGSTEGMRKVTGDVYPGTTCRAVGIDS